MKTLIAFLVMFASLTLSAQMLPDFNALTNKPFVSATSAPYSADPLGKTDSTTAIQNCINDSVAKGAVCALPAGIYKIGSKDATPPFTGLTMQNQSGLYGFQNVGVGTAQLVYYGNGSGTAITIGTCSAPIKPNLVYGVNLVNVSVNAVSPNLNLDSMGKPYPSPKYGIQACGLSEANWDGLSVGNGAWTGQFTGANIRFYESAEIDLLNVNVSNTPYQPNTTGILFDDVYYYLDPVTKMPTIGGGNATITMHGGLSAIYGFQNAIVCKSCVNITVRDALLEANDYGLFVDNSTWTSSYDAVANVYFEGMEFLMDPQLGPTHNKVLQVNSPSGGQLRVSNLVFRNTKWQLQGTNGVTFPVVLNIPSVGQYSAVSVKFDTNSIAGVNTAVVSSNNTLASIYFTGENDITDPNGIARPADVSGSATVTDYAFLNPNPVLVEIGTTNTAIVSRASTSNPPLVNGLTVTVPLGHPLQAGLTTFAYEIPISSCSAGPASTTVCTSTSAPATGDTVTISGLTPPWGGGNGTWTATNLSSTTFSIPFNSSGITGPFSANSPGWGKVIPIRSSFNPGSNIAKGYATGGAIVLLYTPAGWLDLKQ